MIQEKEEIVNKILENTVYLKEAKLYRTAYLGLLKLNVNELAALELVLQFKNDNR